MASAVEGFRHVQYNAGSVAIMFLPEASNSLLVCWRPRCCGFCGRQTASQAKVCSQLGRTSASSVPTFFQFPVLAKLFLQ